jgi:hypothetical protein
MRPEYDRAVSTCASVSHFSRCHCSRSGTQVGYRQRGNAASAVAGWAIAVRARGFTVRLGRTMRLSALLPLLSYRQLAWTFISRRCRPSRGRKDGQGQPRHSSGHHENRWSEVHPEANLRDHYRSTTALCHLQTKMFSALDQRVPRDDAAAGARWASCGGS